MTMTERWNVWCTDYDGWAFAEDFSSKVEAVAAMDRDMSIGYFPVLRDAGLPWRPIAELADKYESGLLLLAPELVDLDCNPDGVGMGYWQDDGLLWHASQEECDKRDPDRDYGSWMACKWSMTNDEWAHVCCTPTHYLKLTGVVT